MAGQKAAETLKSAGNNPDLSFRSKRRSRKILAAGLGSHQNFLIGNPGRWRLRGDKSQLEVVDDPVHHGELGDKGNITL
jgi:hypothetical protein